MRYLCKFCKSELMKVVLSPEETVFKCNNEKCGVSQEGNIKSKKLGVVFSEEETIKVPETEKEKTDIET